MFLNAPLRRKTAALSGLSDEPAGPAAGEEFCRVGSLPAQRKFRNTPFLRLEQKTYPRRLPGGGTGRRQTRKQRQGPCDGCVYPALTENKG